MILLKAYVGKIERNVKVVLIEGISLRLVTSLDGKRRILDEKKKKVMHNHQKICCIYHLQIVYGTPPRYSKGLY